MFNIKKNNLNIKYNKTSLNYNDESEEEIENHNTDKSISDILSNGNIPNQNESEINLDNSLTCCDNKLNKENNNDNNFKRKNLKITIKMTKACITEENSNHEIKTKETTLVEKYQLIGKNLIVSKENLYLNYDINENRENNILTNIDNNKLNDIIRDSNIQSCENILEAENLQTLVKSEEFDKRLFESSQQNRMRLVIGLLLRLVLPFANGVASRIKNFRTDKIWKMLRNLGTNRQTITNMLAYAANTISLGLSSVQVSHRIDPIIQIIKLKKAQIFERNGNHRAIKNTSSFSETTNQINWETQQRIIYSPIRHLSIPKVETPELIETAEQCISIKVLTQPPEGEPIRADIIFMHGLHGSLPNTWKQGLWSNERMPVDFERPPKPPLRPPKRPRYSRSNVFVPPHSNKKPRWAENLSENDIQFKNDQDDFDFFLNQDNKENIIYFNSSSSETLASKITKSSSSIEQVDYNLNLFSTFRLRLNDYDNPSPRPRSAVNRPKHAEPTAEDIFPFEQPYSRCWPGDWLPLDCPGVRVIAVNYTTDPHLWRPIWIKKHHRSSMSERVRVMTEHLIKLKVGHNRPIVWVGHSKGGLFIKQILVEAWESGKATSTPLWKSSRGVFFYSVPHRGSTLADINLPFVRRSIELIEIEKNSKVLLDLHRRFVNLYYSGHLKIEVFSFVETALTFMQVVYLRIVGVDSADPGIGDVCGLQLDHREICKPRSRKCILYTELVKMINKVC